MAVAVTSKPVAGDAERTPSVLGGNGSGPIDPEILSRRTACPISQSEQARAAARWRSRRAEVLAKSLVPR